MENRTNWRVVLLACGVAVLAGLVAPAPWSAGQGRITVTYLGHAVLDEEVRIGGATAIELSGEQIDLELPDGIPVDRPVRAWVTVAGAAPDLDEIKITLTLPDGDEELIPNVRLDGPRLAAQRNPPTQSALALAILGLVIVLWITEAVPLHITALCVPIVLVVANATPARDALAPFFSPIIVLFFGGFLMAEAMRRVKLDRLVAVSIVAWAGRSPVMLFAAMIGTSAFLSMWMSNTASTAVLIPIALAVTEPIGHLGYRKAVVLGIAYAATTGGVGSYIGTPANPIAARYLESFAGREIAFVDWFAYGLPFVLLFLPVMGFYLWKRSRVEVDPAAFLEARRVAVREVRKPSRTQTVVLAVFACVIALWLTQKIHGINVGIIALMGAVALALLGKVLPEDLGRISWSALLTFGGGLALGDFLSQSGTADWIATRLSGLSGMPTFVGVAATAFLALGLTAVASNTATAAMMVPLAIPLAGVLGTDPVLLVVVVAVASSVDYALVIGTPPTMIAYSTKLFTTREIFRTGIALDFLGILVLITAVVGLWSLLGLV
jgi:sodium-dependent dicarboxylate transporter 2/3/5